MDDSCIRHELPWIPRIRTKCTLDLVERHPLPELPDPCEPLEHPQVFLVVNDVPEIIQEVEILPVSKQLLLERGPLFGTVVLP